MRYGRATFGMSSICARETSGIRALRESIAGLSFPEEDVPESDAAKRSMKAVFTLSESGEWDDDPFSRYHYPREGRNHSVAEKAIGDWVVFYRSGKNLKEKDGGRSYTGCAKIRSIDPADDSGKEFYARMSNYIEFEPFLSFRIGPKKGKQYYEKAGMTVGKTHWQSPMRSLSDNEFETIVRAALVDLFDQSNERKYDIDRLSEEDRSHFYTGPGSVTRPIETILLNKKVRDRNFKKNVRAAYRNRCAVTRFDLTNGGGRPEVQACHIRPVEKDGPDVVQNGIALSGTVHWMFDRGLISFSKDLKLLVSHNRMPTDLLKVLEANRDDPWFPPEPHLRPRDDFLEWHRDVKFGQHEAEHA